MVVCVNEIGSTGYWHLIYHVYMSTIAIWRFVIHLAYLYWIFQKYILSGIRNRRGYHTYTRARLVRVAPLCRPRSLYKSNVECRFLCENDGQIHYKLSRRQVMFPRISSQMTNMTLKVRVNDLHFQYQPSIPRCMFGSNLVILNQIFDE